MKLRLALLCGNVFGFAIAQTPATAQQSAQELFQAKCLACHSVGTDRLIGPGLAGVGANYIDLNDPAKWALTFAMMLGRLEVFTLLILFTGAFWRR